jgi:hypothetical protein
LLLLLNAANINLLKPTIYPTQGEHANITELTWLKEKTFLCVKKKKGIISQSKINNSSLDNSSTVLGV